MISEAFYSRLQQGFAGPLTVCATLTLTRSICHERAFPERMNQSINTAQMITSSNVDFNAGVKQSGRGGGHGPTTFRLQACTRINKGVVLGRLDNKVAIITGGASGMGLAAVSLFAAEGAQVVAADMATDRLEKAVAELNTPNVRAVTLDVSSEESWQNLLSETLSAFGRVDILVNNAGLHLGPEGGILQTTLGDWNKVLSVDLTGAWLGMKTVIPEMQKNGKGSIINTSSVAAMLGGLADGGSAAYSAAKGGVRSLTKHAAQAFAGENIRVNSVHPGVTMTGGSGGNFDEEATARWMETLAKEVPLPPHYGEAIDQAYAYLYLASDEAKYITGTELVVDGGWTSH